MYSAARARSSGGRPLTRAAASGESGSGNLASSWVSATPDSRSIVSASRMTETGPGRMPDWAGLSPRTRAPRACARAAIAAVTTVFPMPVPVPVITRTPRGAVWLAAGSAIWSFIEPQRLPDLVHGAPPQPGDELVPVAPVPRLRPLHRLPGGVDRVPRQQQQRDSRVHAERIGVARVGQGGFDRLFRLGQLDAVPGAQRLVQRRVPLELPAQPGEPAGGQVRGVDRHRLAVGEPEAVDAEQPGARAHREERR